MRRIERTKAFKRDYQRVIATPKHHDLDNLLPAILTLLATDTDSPGKPGGRRLGAELGQLAEAQSRKTRCFIYF
jgi:mRNA-degrading endonuclease YafQ of YafQ-DinJ toxin-antitoxin module